MRSSHAALIWAVCVSAPHAPAQGAEVLRDPWGVPHVFADSDEGAMYGLGWVTAEDRGFQMHYGLRIIQGRLAELIGDRPQKRRRRGTAVGLDRKMRSFGFYRVAQEVARNLDRASLALLQAYSDGVNAWFAEHPTDRHYLFKKLGLDPEPWTPADCIAAWWHMGQFFATDGTRDLIASRGSNAQGLSREELMELEQIMSGFERLAPDDEAAIVRRRDVDEGWEKALESFLEDQGYKNAPRRGGGDEVPKFSHAWVVGGTKSTTGAAILLSDPQTPVTNPSLFHEFHVKGKTFNARGIGVPGSPILLIGFTERVAWGVTALGADQADLFRLKTDPARPGKYWFDGSWRSFRTRTETILVKGEDPREIEIRESHLGPLVNEFAFARPGEGPVALKRIPLCERDRETIQGAIAMLRAGNAREFGRALAGWRFPSVNMLFGDKAGNIGYWTLAALPLRSPLSKAAGRRVQDGTGQKHDWRTIVPHELMPHVFNPGRGYILSGNHRAIESFYPIPLGTSTGSLGDTLRSWRLRELLGAKDKFRPEDVLAMHYDTVNPARREIVRLGYHLRDVLKRDLSPESKQALDCLEGWYAAGARSDLRVAGSALATQINLVFRRNQSPLTYRYGGGLSGLSRFLKRVKEGLGRDFLVGSLEADYVDRLLQGAWRSARGRLGRDPSRWDAEARRRVGARRLGYYESLDGFPALDPGQSLAVPGLYCVDGNTIHSQAAQSYTQFVNMADVDRSLSLLPPGQTERPRSRFREATAKLWGAGKLHPAPLSREAVERIAVSRRTLERD
ncbi:MAG: penicillin acylase family protein [Planctomycetota bacterium]